MWFGKEETGRILDQLQVICGLEQMTKDDVMT
jgi:hypothetical protein